MAAVAQPAGSTPTTSVVTRGGPVGKPRQWLGVFFLTLITLGIYGLVWQYKTFHEMKEYSGEGIGGGVGLLLAIVFGVINVFVMPHEVGNLYAREGRDKPVSAKTGFWVLLPIVGGFVWLYKTQERLSDFWREHGAE